MKKIIFPAFTGLVCMLISCDSGTATTSGSGKDSTQAKNIAAFDVVTKAFDTGDPSHIDEVVADDFVDHTDKGEVKGKDSLKTAITMMHNAMKDMKTETLNTAASGDYVYGWMHYTGTSHGSMGMPNGQYDMTSIELVKF
ncbi:MAG: nuclear transport factor 2 family protein, partial [Ginsengibacter sp.]